MRSSSWRKKATFAVAAFGAGALAAFILIMVVGFVFRGPKTYKWLLPDGYAGWVRVDFGVSGAPALGEDDGYRVLPVPLSGVLQTSDALIDAHGREQFWFEAKGVRRKAPAPIAGFTTQPTASADLVQRLDV